MKLQCMKHMPSLLLIIVLLITVILAELENTIQKPNIVIILADDLGFDDVSFRGSNEILTPHIDALAYSGIILNNLYTPAMCTPSRAALLTGKYPTSNGMQHYVIPNDQPWSLPINETTIAQIFQNHGYYTSLIGKWHLGMSRQAYTPSMRGFQEHFGYLGAYIDYYDHTLYSPQKPYARGHDFRHNFKAIHDYTGDYVTDLLTTRAIELIDRHNTSSHSLFLLLSHLAPHSANDEQPLQAPKEEIEKFAYIKNKDRRTYAAMISKLDESVGLVINALYKKGILNNTIILFCSDNGGPTEGMHATTASNYPLRGQKNTAFEGGIRSSAAIWSTEFEKLNRVWKQKIYMADFFPTLAAAANIQIHEALQLDGLNLWSALKYGYESVEREILHNIDEVEPYVAYNKGKWKFINGTLQAGEYDGWLSKRVTTAAEIDPRASYYEQLVRSTNVWQQLRSSYFNTERQQQLQQQKQQTENTVNITQLRHEAEIQCEKTSNKVVACDPLQSPCLFDVDNDPCEMHNLYEELKGSKIMSEIEERIELYRQRSKEPNNKPADVNCDPKYYNYEWTWWQDEQQKSKAANTRSFHILNLLLYFYINYLWLFSI